MARIGVFAGVLLAAVSGCAAAQLVANGSDAGEIYQFSQTSATLTLDNAGDAEITVGRAEAVATDDVIETKFPLVIPPKSSVSVAVQLRPGLSIGSRWHSFRFFSKDGSQQETQARIHFFGLSVLDEPLPKMDLGVVPASGSSATYSIVLRSHEVQHLEITAVKESPDFLTVTLLPEKNGVRVSARQPLAWGRHSAFIKLALDSPLQSEAWIQVEADVHGEVVPSQNPFNLGLSRKGDNRSFLLQLDDIAGKELRIGDIKSEDVALTASKQPCASRAPSCIQLKVKIEETQPTGRLFGKLLVQLPDFGRTLPVEVVGALLGEDAKILSLPTTAPSSDGTSSSSRTPDLKQAIENATTSKPAAEIPSGEGPLLKWKASNEENVYGYAVFRSDRKDGDFHRVNSRTIQVNGAGIYSWRDTSAVKGQSYWYYVGVINRDGTKAPLTDPQNVTAK